MSHVSGSLGDAESAGTGFAKTTNSPFKKVKCQTLSTGNPPAPVVLMTAVLNGRGHNTPRLVFSPANTWGDLLEHSLLLF